MSLILISILLISMTSIYGTYNSTMYALEESMNSTIAAAANMVEAQLDGYKELATQFSIDPILSQEIPEEGETTADGRSYQEVRNEIIEYFELLVITHNIDVMQIFDTQGIALTHGQDFVAEPLFTVPRDTGLAYVADPILSPTTGQLTMTISAPMYSNGQFSGVVLLSINPSVFSEIVSEIKVGEISSTSIINSQGTTIAYNDVSYVFDSYNTIEEAKSDPSLKILADLEQELINGQSGFKSVFWDGANQFASYTPIDGSNGWGIYVMTHQDHFLNTMTNAIIVIIILSTLILVSSAIVIILNARKISKPITLCVARLNQLSQGDLTSPLPQITSKDETYLLAKSTETIVTTLSTIILDLKQALSEVASGNFTTSCKEENYYVGDFIELKETMDIITSKLSSTMSQINSISVKVNQGNNQVADGAQALANSSIEQSSSVDQLSQAINVITNKINETASDSQQAKEANTKSQEALFVSDTHIKDMLTAMANIDKKSKEISSIIKTIDDIAFQTNILALNAAVEAARAGTAGKGFAVVADEVRTLATKSAESARNTAQIIAETEAVVNQGNQIASHTYEAISTALENAQILSNLVDSIASSTLAQSESATQITSSVDQISALVQINSATAEESAATSEELSTQSQLLEKQLSHFSLR